MNYTRGIQPSICTKEQYEAENRKHWYKLSDRKPYAGKPVAVLFMNNELDPQFWTTDIAYYCDGDFYCLEYDPHLGVLRKQFVSEPIEYWSEYYTFSADELHS